jgi:hypothetical protein
MAIGGSGPREHVSLEDGPVSEVVPRLQRDFRTTFPGQPTVNGALYYHPESQKFVWVIVRRPSVGGRMLLGPERHAYEFAYFKPMPIQDEIMTPAISLFWGQGLDQADRVLAEQFDMFEEPPEWWYHTTWFWLHPVWGQDTSFEKMGQGAELLTDGCGVNGFGMLVHDVPWAGMDIDVASPMPSPRHGGGAALRKAVERIRAKGGHTYAWMSQKGHRPDGAGFHDSWSIKGDDGRPIRLHNKPDCGVRLDIINPADPSFFEYISGWIRHYVQDIGINGIFWDSGLQPLPPDFGNKRYLRSPGHGMASTLEFYRRIYQFGRSLSSDFFMWVEGISTDVPMNAFAVDAKNHHGQSGHAMMHRIAHAGPRRLVWRSAWPHELASGFPFINPVNDVGWPVGLDRYREVARDPMNRWLCRTVKERGIRHAVGLADGVSLSDEFVVVCPGAEKTVLVPSQLCKSQRLASVLTDHAIEGNRTECGMQFAFTESGAFRFI